MPDWCYDMTTLGILAKIIAEKADAYEQVEQDIASLNKKLFFHASDQLEIYEQLKQKYAESETLKFEFQKHLDALIEYVEENSCASNLQ